MRSVLSAALAVILAVGSANAATTFYTDRDAFADATAGTTFTLDTFDTDIPAADSITLDSGVQSTNLGGNRNRRSDNRVLGARYENAVEQDGDEASTTVTLMFPDPITAMSFQFADANQGGVRITVGDETASLFASGGSINGFLGAVTTAPINSVLFDSAADTRDGFRLDNLRFGAAAPTTPIPLPAGLPLLAAALGGLGLLSRRHR